jgi:hypothetical protein
MRVHQGVQDRVLIRKVLVERADGDLGALGDAVGGSGRIAVLAENVSCRIQNAVPSLCRTILCRLLAGPKSVWRSDGVHLR